MSALVVIVQRGEIVPRPADPGGLPFRTMTWVLLLVAAALVILGLVIYRYAGPLSRGIRASQQKYLGPWAPPNDRVDEQGLFGSSTPEARESALRGAAIVTWGMAVLAAAWGISQLVGLR
jgi:hypothetical protein